MTQQPEVMVAKFLPVLVGLKIFAQECYRVIANAYQQIAMLHLKSGRFSNFFSKKGSKFIALFQAIGSVCRILVTLDCIISCNSAISPAWAAYKKMLKYVKVEPKSFLENLDAAQTDLLDDQVRDIERSVLNESIFANLLKCDFSLWNSVETSEGTLQVCFWFQLLLFFY